MGNNCPIGEG
ncbi:Protein of unknown function [Bacillus toyonensis]|nr:Protein of unknown function [Bacillus toyonensis]